MKPASEAPRAPYKLFDYYTFADRDLFFGREEEVLRTVGEVLSTRLLVLFAPSGSGKSSLINAGVRPKLEERGFATVTVRLDCAPDLAIKRRLREKFPEVFGSLSDDTDLVAGLRTAYAPKDGQPAPKPLVLFLDQFEEFFIVWRDKPEVRRAFIKQVAQIKFDTRLPVYLVLSLRDDYFVHLNEFREEIPSIFHNNANIQLRPLDDAAALRAIVEPARICGLEFEPGLPEQIIADLKHLQARDEPERGVHAASPADAAGASEKQDALKDGTRGSGLKAALPDAADIGVLPITLQIVCHKLWEKRPAKGQPVTRQLYAGSKEEGGLGGAAAIIRRQLDESLQQIPRSEYGLMRKLFRVLMTADLTKRLRSIDDLAEILRLRDREKLKALLENLTKVSVLREEHSEKSAWYEFRHDYLVKEVSQWLARLEARLRRRRLVLSVGLGVLPALALLVLGTLSFLTYEVRFAPTEYEGQSTELEIVRRWNPFGLHIGMGFWKSDVSAYPGENHLKAGFALPFGHSADWHTLTNVLAEGALPELVFMTSDLQHGVARLLVPPPEFAGAREVRAKLTWEQLSKLGHSEPALPNALLALLNDNASDVRLRAAEALVQLGQSNESVVTGLLALFKDNASYDRLSAAAALGQLGHADETVVTGLLALLKDNDSGVRQSAAAALGQLGQAEEAVVTELLVLLKDNASYVRQSAALALGQLGKADAPVVEGLVALLKDSASDVRQRAAEALGQLGKTDAPVVAGLVALLRDSASSVRQRAPEALGQLGKADAPVVEGLVALLKDSDSGVRQSAAEALGQLGQADEAVVTGLLAALKDNASDVRRSAAAALGQLGKTDAPVVEGLVALLKDSDSGVRQSAAAALGKLGQRKRNDGTFEWGDDWALAKLQDNLSGWRKTAGMVLANRPNLTQATYDQVMALRNDSRPWVRLAEIGEHTSELQSQR